MCMLELKGYKELLVEFVNFLMETQYKGPGEYIDLNERLLFAGQCQKVCPT